VGWVLNSRWRNLVVLLLLLAALFWVSQSGILSNLVPARYLEFVFSSDQLSQMDAGAGVSDAEKMESIRRSFQIYGTDEVFPAASGAELRVRQTDDSHFALLIPNLRAGSDYQYVMNPTGFAIIAGEINDVQSEELVDE